MRFKFCPKCGERLIFRDVGDEGMVSYCSKCDCFFPEVFTTCILCAVVNQYNEVALLKQNYVSSDKYVCVAGIVKSGEPTEMTAIREIKEEIGLEVRELQYVHSFFFEEKDMLMLGYKAFVEKAEFNLSKEVDYAEWVKFGEALEKMIQGSIGWQLVQKVIG